jgi:hypothetical protein
MSERVIIIPPMQPIRTDTQRRCPKVYFKSGTDKAVTKIGPMIMIALASAS